MHRRLLTTLWGVLLLSGCTSSVPSSILLQVSAEPSLAPPDVLRLDLYGERGLLLEGLPLPARGTPALPAALVLYPPAGAGELRLRVLAWRSGAMLGEGVTRVTPLAGRQVSAALLLERGRRDDGDGDGVPDLIDNCPALANMEQAPCPGAEAGVDGPGDGAIPVDGQPDTLLRPCKTPADCVDGHPCTDDRCQNGFCTYGPVVCPPSGNPCRRAPRCDPQSGCVEDPKPNGAACIDAVFCTIEKSCQAGSCQGQPRDCTLAAPACTTSRCDDTAQACVHAPLATGTACDDGDPCTQEDRCTPQGCVAPPLTQQIVEAQSISARGDRAAVIDTQGALHAIYRTASSNALHYATNASGNWVVQVLDSGQPPTGEFYALAQDATGTLHAAYAFSDELRYARFSPGQAATVTLENVTTTGGHTAIAVSAAGAVHISHARAGALWYATRGAGPWTHEEVFATTSGDVVHTSIALDAAGRVHIATGVGGLAGADYYSNELAYASNTAGPWQTQIVPASGPNGRAGRQPSIVVAASGAVHIAHGATMPTLLSGYLLVSSRASASASWSTSVAAAGMAGADVSLVLGASDHLHLLHRDFGGNELLYLNNAKGPWSTPLLLASGAAVGRWGTLLRAPGGRLHAIHGGSRLEHVHFSACQ